MCVCVWCQKIQDNLVAEVILPPCAPQHLRLFAAGQFDRQTQLAVCLSNVACWISKDKATNSHYPFKCHQRNTHTATKSHADSGKGQVMKCYLHYFFFNEVSDRQRANGGKSASVTLTMTTEFVSLLKRLQKMLKGTLSFFQVHTHTHTLWPKHCITFWPTGCHMKSRGA